jgi:hypothetical protein
LVLLNLAVFIWLLLPDQSPAQDRPFRRKDPQGEERDEGKDDPREEELPACCCVQAFIAVILPELADLLQEAGSAAGRSGSARLTGDYPQVRRRAPTTRGPTCDDPRCGRSPVWGSDMSQDICNCNNIEVALSRAAFVVPSKGNRIPRACFWCRASTSSVRPNGKGRVSQSMRPRIARTNV